MISRRQIISRSTGPIFAIFTSNESFLAVDDRSGPWQPNNIAKMYQRRLIPPEFGALELENELQYHGLAMRINSAYDACVKVS